jgi:hypothetical protein
MLNINYKQYTKFSKSDSIVVMCTWLLRALLYTDDQSVQCNFCNSESRNAAGRSRPASIFRTLHHSSRFSYRHCISAHLYQALPSATTRQSPYNANSDPGDELILSVAFFAPQGRRSKSKRYFLTFLEMDQFQQATDRFLAWFKSVGGNFRDDLLEIKDLRATGAGRGIGR